MTRSSKRFKVQENQKTPQRRKRRLSFAAVFPASGAGTSREGVCYWRIRGSGTAGAPESATWTRAIVDLLRRNGISVDSRVSTGMVNAEMYSLSAKFLDGGLSATTGNYIGGERGAWVTGARAAAFVALGLDLVIQNAKRGQERLNVGLRLDDLLQEIRTSVK
jgi:hypothetical protein